MSDNGFLASLLRAGERQHQAQLDRNAAPGYLAETAMDLMEEYEHEINSWTYPLDGISRAIGSAIAGQNPFVDGSIQGPTVSEALRGRGTHPLLAGAAEFLVPDPTGAKKLRDLAPLAGLLLTVPKGWQRALGQGMPAHMLDDLGLPRQQGHGTTRTFDTPEPPPGASSLGRAHYTDYIDAPDARFNTFAGEPSSFSTPQVRLDTSILENPFHMTRHGVTAAPIRPSEPEIALLREWLRYAEPYSPGAGEALRLMDEIDARILAGGAEMRFEEFRRIANAGNEGMFELSRHITDLPDVNMEMLASRAYGVDGTVRYSGGRSEVAAYDPSRSTINSPESAAAMLRRKGYSDEWLQSADPEGWARLAPAEQWPQPTPSPTSKRLGAWPRTPLDLAATPTKETILQVAREGGQPAVANWLVEVGVEPHLARVVAEAAEMAVISTGNSVNEWMGTLHDTLYDAYRRSTSSPIAYDADRLMEAYRGPLIGPRPEVFPDPRLYPEREILAADAEIRRWVDEKDARR